MLTAALSRNEQGPFAELGFVVHERLHLLRHDLRDMPRARRGRAPAPGAALRPGRGCSSSTPGPSTTSGASTARASPTPGGPRRRAGSASPRAGPRGRHPAPGWDDTWAAPVSWATPSRVGPVTSATSSGSPSTPTTTTGASASALVADSLWWARRRGAAVVLVNTQETNVGRPVAVPAARASRSRSTAWPCSNVPSSSPGRDAAASARALGVVAVWPRRWSWGPAASRPAAGGRADRRCSAVRRSSVPSGPLQDEAVGPRHTGRRHRVDRALRRHLQQRRSPGPARRLARRQAPGREAWGTYGPVPLAADRGRAAASWRSRSAAARRRPVTAASSSPTPACSPSSCASTPPTADPSPRCARSSSACPTARTEQARPCCVAPIIGLRAPVALRPDGTRAARPTATPSASGGPSPAAVQPGRPAHGRSAARDHRRLGAGQTAPAASSVRAAIGNRQVLASTLVDVDVDQWLTAGLRDQVERQRQIGPGGPGRPRSLVSATAADTSTWVARHPLGLESRGDAPAAQRAAGRAAGRARRPGRPGRGPQPVAGRRRRRRPAALPAHPRRRGGPAPSCPTSGSPAGSPPPATPSSTPRPRWPTWPSWPAARSPGHGAGRHCNSVPTRAPGGSPSSSPTTYGALDTLDRVLAGDDRRAQRSWRTDLDGLFDLSRPAAARRDDRGPPLQHLPGLGHRRPRRLRQPPRRHRHQVHGYRSMLVEPPADDTAAAAEFDPAAGGRPRRRAAAAARRGRRGQRPRRPDAYLDAVAAEITATLAGSTRPATSGSP